MRASAALGLMTVFCNQDRWEKSNVLLRDGRVAEYDKRSPRPGYASHRLRPECLVDAGLAENPRQRRI